MPDEMEAWERELEQELADLGPVMRRQEQVEAMEPDPAFRQALRARLVDEPLAPATRVAEPDGVPGTTARARRRITFPVPRRWVWGGGLAAAAVAAALIALLSSRQSSSNPPQQAVIALPTPNATQLSQGYPLLGGIGAGGGGMPPPWAYLLELPSGGAYPGHLRLSAPSFPALGGSAPAYRLDGPSFAASRLARLARVVGIHGAVKQSATQGDGAWRYAWDQSAGSAHPVNHSIAVNLQTGQLLYHNLSAGNVLPGLPLNTPRNVAIAQAWLTRLGWPGGSMTVHVPTSGQERDLRDTVSLGWAGVGPANVPAAMLLIDTYGRVEIAQVWPPVAQVGAVSTRPIATAWQDVQAGKAPVAVIPKQIGEPFNAGVGTLHSASIIQVFTQTPQGRLYLAPAYWFKGVAAIRGVGQRPWFALSPAAP